MKKRILTLALAACLILTLAPSLTSPADAAGAAGTVPAVSAARTGEILADISAAWSGELGRAIEDMLFKSDYSVFMPDGVTVRSGTSMGKKAWPATDADTPMSSVADRGETVDWGWMSAGDTAYARFFSQSVYGTVGARSAETVKLGRSDRASWQTLKEFLKTRVQPGEVLRTCEKGGAMRSLVYLGMGAENGSDGFYAVEYGGGAALNGDGEMAYAASRDFFRVRFYTFPDFAASYDQCVWYVQDAYETSDYARQDAASARRGILIAVEAPVDAQVSLDGETLSRSIAKASFGALAVTETSGGYKYLFDLEDSADYEILLRGLGDGSVHFKITYTEGDAATYREFTDVPVTADTVITASPTDRRADFALYTDSGKDGKADAGWLAGVNGTANAPSDQILGELNPAEGDAADPAGDTENIYSNYVGWANDIPSPGETIHVITSTEDSLASIAQRYLGNANRWPEIWARNRGVLWNVNGINPVDKEIVLFIPEKEQNPLVPDHGKFYIIQRDDTVVSIARRVWGSGIYAPCIITHPINQALINTNRLRGRDDFNIGDEIYIPMLMNIPSQGQVESTYAYRYYQIYVYTVKPGDTLQSVAKAVYGDSAFWTVLLANNRSGAELAMEESPRTTAALTDGTVKPGDVLFVPMVENVLPGAMNFKLLERAYVYLKVQVSDTESVMMADGNYTG